MYVILAGLMAASFVLATRVLYGARFLFTRKHACPRCGKALSLRREPRKKFDRYIGQFVETRRYKCLVCQWSGLLRNENDPDANYRADDH